jgi:hypothetical protein
MAVLVQGCALRFWGRFLVAVGSGAGSGAQEVMRCAGCFFSSCRLPTVLLFAIDISLSVPGTYCYVVAKGCWASKGSERA